MSTARAQQNTIRILPAIIAICVAFAIALAAIIAQPSAAYADTESDLADAKARYEKIEKRLNVLAAEYQELSIQQANTLAEIEQTQNDIDAAEDEIAALEVKLAEEQEKLAEVMVNEYKNGTTNYLDVLLDSEDFGTFVSNTVYLERVYASKQEIIDECVATKEALDNRVNKLNDDMAALETLRAEQQTQLEAMHTKQAEVQKLLNEADDEVKKLTEKHNRELAARAAQANQRGGSTYQSVIKGAKGKAVDVINACYTTPSPGANWCAAYVTNVFRNAGIGTFWGDACDMYNNWCTSSNRADLKPGMIIAVNTNTFGLAGRLYGHIGIYIGNGLVMENIGSIVTTPLDQWINTYATLVPARWGWLGGVVLN